MKNISNYLGRLRGFNRNAKLFLLSTFLNGLAISLLVLLYNLYILSLGFQQDMIGLVTLVASLTAVAASIPMAWAAHRLGYKAAQALGLAGAAVSIGLALVFPSAEALIATELIWGVAFTLTIIVGAPFMSENSSTEERPYLFSIQYVLLTITMFIGSLVGGELPRLFGDILKVDPTSPGAYQGALSVAVALMFASALPLLFLNSGKGRHGHTVRPRWAVHSRSQVVRLILPGLLSAAGGGMFVPFVNVFWRLSHNLDDATIGQIFAFSALLMTALGLFAPVMSKKWGIVRVMVVSQVLSIVGLLLFGFTPWFMIALVGYLGRDVLMNLSRPLLMQFQMDESSAEERAAVSSLSTMVFNLFWGIGSWVSGLWQTQGQLALVFGVSAFFFLASAGSLQILFGHLPIREASEGAVLPTQVIAVGSAVE